MNSAPAQSHINNAAVPALAALLLLCFAALCIHSMLRHSATFDEHVYVTAGSSYFETRQFRMKLDAPPLIATTGWLALKVYEFFNHPLTFSQINPHWINLDEYEAAKDFFTRDNAGGIIMLRYARTPIILLGILLGIYVFRFSRLLFGDWGALLSLLVFAFDPNMIAHSTIVSADLGLAAFFLATHYYFYRAVSEASLWRLPPLALFVALTVAVKFTGLVVFPSLLFLTVVIFAFPPAVFLTSLNLTVSQYRKSLLKRALISVVASITATFILVSLLYHSLGGVFSYIEGARLIYRNVTPGFNYYFWGEFRQRAWPQYYLAATLLKTPPATLFLFGLAFIPWRRLRNPTPLIALMIPFALVHLVSAFDQANFGLRRVLLAFPFMFVMIGAAAQIGSGIFSDASRFKKWIPALSVGFLALSVVVSAAIIHPHQLSYFNLFIGGPKNGHLYLSDSNIDWGQDLPALADYARADDVGQIALGYFGTDEPALYGIEWKSITDEDLRNPKPVVYAISVQNLIYRRLNALAYGDHQTVWLDRFKPTAKAGYSIYIYDFR